MNTNRVRSSKKELYKSERLELLDKLNKILGIDENNNKIYLCDIENDDEIKLQILSLVSDVKKYFKCGGWTVFCKEQCKDNHVSLMKYIYKDMGYDIISKQIASKNNNEVTTSLYTICKINNPFEK